MVNIIFGICITFIIQIIPGYFLASLSIFCKRTLIERFYFGYIITLSLSIFFGFIAARMNLFKPIIFLYFLIIYNIISIVLFKKYSKNINLKYDLNKETLLILFLTVIAFSISLFYIRMSPFPIGWDRGTHFGKMLYSLNFHKLYTKQHILSHNPFYFEGPNIVCSIFVGTSSLLSGFILDINIYDYNIIKYTSIIFKIYISFLISILTIAIFTISKKIYQNRNISIFSSIIFISILGWNIADSPSISFVFGIILMSIYIIYLNSFGTVILNKYDYVFFSLITISIFLTHILASLYIGLYSLFELFRKLIVKEITYKELKVITITLILCIIINVLFLFTFHPLLLQGIFEEISRKILISSNYWTKGGNNVIISHFSQNVNRISEGTLTLLISFILSIFGLYYEVRNKLSTIILLSFVSLLFIFFPMFGLRLIKPELIMLYPLTILGGVGSYYFLYKKILIKIPMIIQVFIIVLILFFGTTVSVYSVSARANKRYYWYREELYKEQHELSVWLNTNFTSPQVILFPESGPAGEFLRALSNHIVLTADPRFPDVPIKIEVSKVYLSISTSNKIFDYTNISGKERYEIIKKYNISIIIQTNKITDLESLKLFFEIQTYQPTPQYSVIVLEKHK